MEIMMSALWRGVFMGNESIKEPHVRVIAEYLDSELADVYEIDAVRGVRLLTVRAVAEGLSANNPQHDKSIRASRSFQEISQLLSTVTRCRPCPSVCFEIHHNDRAISQR